MFNCMQAFKQISIESKRFFFNERQDHPQSYTSLDMSQHVQVDTGVSKKGS